MLNEMNFPIHKDISIYPYEKYMSKLYKIDFSNWNSISVYPKENKLFFISDGIHTPFICISLDEKIGYIETPCGLTYFADFISDLDLKYWIYVDDFNLSENK